MKVVNSSTSTTRNHLMYMVEKMLKAKRFKFGRDTMVLTKDGESSILIRLPRKQLLDTAENGVCISTDCSISDPDSQ
jgi:hypothetical protein